jgi:hypothetical protein
MAIANIEAVDPAPPIASRQMRNAIVASVLGWSLDLFDLFILLYVAPVVGALFFPSSAPTLSLAAVYASFAVTLLMRPVGSAVFGHYADVYGRKNAMLVAIVGVGISTAAFGLLPTIAQAGIYRAGPVPDLAPRSRHIRRWRGCIDPHHWYRVRSTCAARSHVRACRWRWRRHRSAAGIVGIPDHVIHLSRGRVCGVGLAVHVLLGTPEFIFGLVHFQQS